MADPLEEIIKAMEQLQTGQVRVLQQARSARESVADQMEKLRTDIAATGENLIRSVGRWDEETLTRLRRQEMCLVKSLGTSTSPDEVKRLTVDDLSIAFLPSPPGVMDLIGTLAWLPPKPMEDETHAPETIVGKLKVQMEKELRSKKKGTGSKTSMSEQGARGDLCQSIEESDFREGDKDPVVVEEALVEQTKKAEDQVDGLRVMSTDEQQVANQECENDSKESAKSNECTPRASNMPLWAIEGSHCLARWNEDGVWYEAQVLRHVAPNLCMVLFVSHGNCAEVAPDDMVKELTELQAGQPIDPLLQRNLKPEMELSVKDGLKPKEAFTVDQIKQMDIGKGDLAGTWELGSVCVARWADDGVWYRAKVIEALEGNCYTVCFVDYGNTAMTTWADMVVSRREVPEGEVLDDHVVKDRQVGSACWALYKEEMVWCRVNLIEKTQHGWEVEFTDYGGEIAEVGEGDVVDSLEQVPLDATIDRVTNGIEEEVVVEQIVAAGSKAPAEMKQMWEERNTMAYAQVVPLDTSRVNHEVDVDEDEGQEPSMELEEEEEIETSKPVVPLPRPSGHSLPTSPPLSNPGPLLQPGDTCLAVWPEDGLLEWHPGHTGADVLFVDYDNVESVGLDDMYTNFSDVPACIPVDIYVETGGNATAPPPPIEETSPALRLKLNWSVEIISWSPQQSTRLAILPNGKVVVALPHKHVVLLFNKEGKAKGHLGTFENPHGVSALEGGKVAVLDNERIVVFSKSGEEHKFVPQGLNTATGLCVDEEGALVTINRCSQEEKSGTVTKPGQTDLLFIQEKSEKIEKRLEMEDIVEEDSYCTLLASSKGRIHVGDQGLSQVYTLYMEEGELQATVSGGPQLWHEVSSIAGMSDGGVLVLDAVTQRILRLSASGELMGHAEVEGELQEARTVATWQNSLVVASNGALAMYKMEEI